MAVLVERVIKRRICACRRAVRTATGQSRETFKRRERQAASRLNASGDHFGRDTGQGTSILWHLLGQLAEMLGRHCPREGRSVQAGRRAL